MNADNYSLETILEPEKCVLIVVDIQNRFCHPDEKFAREGKDVTRMQSVVPHIQNLINIAHSKNILVIFTKIYDREDKLNEPGKRRRLKWIELNEEPLVGPQENTFGAEFYELKPATEDTILEKYDWSAFTGKDREGRDLEKILKEKSIYTLVVTGVKTEVCVGATVRDGYMRGYFVVVPKEAVGSDNKELHETNLKNFDPIYGDVVKKDEILKIWSSS